MATSNAGSLPLRIDHPSLSHRLSRLGFWGVVGWIPILLLVPLSYLRFGKGIGAVTNLTDAFPWGLWVGFDVLCGVGLAAGGFAVTTAVYVLHLEEYRPIVRPSVLTAFLGYILAIAGLAFDLGKPWNIWRPLVQWNPGSVMFEVGWCVILYTSVLFLEFSPVWLERFGLKRPLAVIKKVTPALVIVGVVLSTLHQSSLGSLFLILPEKMHPLWYSPLLPVLFFVSAVAVGLAMTVVESAFSRRAFGRPLETHLLDGLSRVSVLVLGLFLMLRLRDLIARDALAALWQMDREAVMFLAETLFGFALPMVLLAFGRIRHNPTWLTMTQGLVVLGFIVNRLNVTVTAAEAAKGIRYVPAVYELLISIGLVALGLKLFVFACRHLPIFSEPRAEARA